MKNEFYKRIEKQRKLLLMLLVLVFILFAVGNLSLVLLLLEGINHMYPLMEQYAFCAVLSLLAVFSLHILKGLYVIIKNHFSLVDVARMVEYKHPKLMESLSAAVEIADKREPEGVLETALFKKVDKDTSGINFLAAVLPGKLSPIKTAIGGIGLCVMAWLILNSQVLQKTLYYGNDLKVGAFSGLYVDPGNAELPRGSDVKVNVSVNRWEVDPVIRYRQNGVEEQYSMTIYSEQDAEFTLYGLNDDVEYMIETSSLKTAWFSIRVYEPPAIDELKIRIEPPSYTGEDIREYDQFTDIFMTEGSSVVFSVKTKEAVKTEMLLGEKKRIPFDAGVLRIAPLENTKYQIALENAEGRKSITDFYGIEVIEDENPVIQIVEPGKDIKSKSDGLVPVQVYAADDYGITRVEIHVTISGKEIEPLLVYKRASGEESVRETSLDAALDIAELGAKHADVVSYYATVWDNKEPVPQMGKTEIFFVEVMDALEPKESPMEGEGQKEELDLRPLIIELKRLIRVSNSALYMEGDELELNRQEIGAGLSALNTEGQALIEKFTSILTMMGLPDALSAIDNAFEKVVEAERHVNEHRISDALKKEQEAYSHLILAESLLQQQKGKGKGQGDSGEQSESQSEENSEGQEQGEGSDDGKMSMSQMKDMLKKLDKIIDKQSEMNARYKRAEKMDLSEAEKRELADMQNSIHDEAKKLDHDLLQFEGMGDVRGHIKVGASEMKNAQTGANSGNCGKANRSGNRAKESLLNASDMLSDKLQEAAQASVRSLANKSGQLAEAERAAAEASEKAGKSGGDSVTAKQMREYQQKLQEEYAKMLDQMNEAAVELDEFYPEVSRELSELSRKSESGSAEKNMKRAGNALLYERFGKAAEQQNKAADELNQIVDGMQNVMGHFPGMTAEQLSNLMNRILEAREELAYQQFEQQEGQSEGNAESEINAMYEEMGKRLSEAGQRMNNSELAQYGDEMEASKFDTSNSSAGYGEAARALDEAAKLIQKLMMSNSGTKPSMTSRKSFQAPEKYRRLVEEYFKNLAEEK